MVALANEPRFGLQELWWIGYGNAGLVPGDGDGDARKRSSWKVLRRNYAGGGDCGAGRRKREEQVLNQIFRESQNSLLNHVFIENSFVFWIFGVVWFVATYGFFACHFAGDAL